MNGMNSLTLIMWFETSAMKLNDFLMLPNPWGRPGGIAVGI
jgi:hypothetical protein